MIYKYKQKNHYIWKSIVRMEPDYLELLELQTLIREGIEEILPGPVRVRAEIASLQRRTNGHCYLELCESGPRGPVAKVRAVIWRSAWESVAGKFFSETGENLREGLSLVFEVTVNYSELYGLTLVIGGIDVGLTLGEAELARRRTLEKLEEEGLMDLQKELALPDIPYDIAVISAPDAAGYGDFRRHLLENEYGFAFNVQLYEATMQGENAPASIRDAMSRILLEEREPDAVFILRGGGSALDLACFDDYSLAAAIARYPIPVYTAIGHDRDVHVADLVACGSVKTPTALADLLIDAVAAEDERIGAYVSRLRIAFGNKISSVEAACQRMLHRAALAFSAKISLDDARIATLQARIASADPRTILSRGYALVADEKGALVKSASAVSVGDSISVRYSDGTLNCKVNGKV